jgi:RHS repeat-associated protein
LNREKISDFGLGVENLNARMYDSIIQRFWSTDQKIDEGQQSFTPYHYSFNNPVRFSDPDGLEPCCQGLIDFTAGVASAMIEDFAPVDVGHDVGYRSSAHSAGRKTGHIFAAVSGVAETIAGIVGDAAAGTAEFATAGAATPVAIPVATGSTFLIGHGLGTLAKAVSNLNSEGKVPNPDGKKGGEKHQETNQKEANRMKEEGKNVQSEVYVKTPNGKKTGRFIDQVGTNPKTGEKEMIQVGKQNKNGTPVKRERDAMDDIQKETGQRPKFVPYN